MFSILRSIPRLINQDDDSLLQKNLSYLAFTSYCVKEINWSMYSVCTLQKWHRYLNIVKAVELD